MKTALILIVACAFAAAMVPKEKRAINPEDSVQMKSTSARPHEVCARQTPCAWSIYRPNVKLVEHTIINSYCDCGPGTVCEVSEDDSTANALIHRCRVPRDTDES